MNIFDVLSPRRDNKLREGNLSALLAYLLNPAEDHGARDAFLDAFLELVQDALEEGEIFSDIQPNQTKIKTEVSVDSENEKGRKKFLDVVVELFNEDGPTHVLVIENKVRPSAAQGKQLKNYYAAARKKYENKKIVMVFLTPGGGDKKPLNKEYDALTDDDLQSGDCKAWLRWNDKRDDKKSVQSIVRDNILTLEAAGKVAPINEYSRHTLKALSMHLEEYNMGARKASSGVRKPAEDYPEKESYLVDGYCEVVITEKPNGVLCAYARDLKTQKRIPKSNRKLFMHINKEKSLGIPAKANLGNKHERNTHQWGIAVLEALKKRESDV